MNKQKGKQEPWVGLHEAAHLMGISWEAMRRLVERGTIAHRRRRDEGAGGQKRIEVERTAIKELLADRRFKNRSRARGGR